MSAAFALLLFALASLTTGSAAQTQDPTAVLKNEQPAAEGDGISVEAIEAEGAATDDAPAAAPAPTGAASAPALLPGLDPRTEIVVSAGEFEPIPVALPRFRATDPAYEPYAVEISDVIAADLERSGLFTVVGGPPLGSIDVSPDIDGWARRGAVALIAGEVTVEADGRLGVRFRLWDLDASEQRHQLKFLSSPTGSRRVAHKLADIVYSEFTGETPYFDTRVVFVEVQGPKENRRWRLAIMDSDGENVTYLTSDQHLVMTPRFSPATQEITFVSDRDGLPEIYLLNLITERQEKLGAYPGMSFAPRFSPSGEFLVMSLANEEGTDIYMLNLARRDMRRLTHSARIDTAPSFAPDGSRIVFESDREDGQQIYVMDTDGSNQQRISFGPGRYSTPVWSPTGEWIAFTKHLNSQFYIGIMRPDGSEERLLTSSYLDEGPTWAPNGRVLMFYREPPGSSSLPQLYTIDIYGRGEQLLPTDYGATDPAWSPLLDN